ncbi:MAG TPA: hypothetical protein VFE19_01220 [Jatrophihabitantaceae bacterium]|jgi:uncharacterized protein YbjT (DUF2867 family)|nr:hypothetical protein [Jatrophihabitantaceae bacterium]
MRIAVAGGTGVAGVQVVNAVRAAGHEPVALSRQNGVDVMTETGLDAALDGAGALIDATNVTTNGRKRAVEFFTTATRNLLAAERRAGVGHHVALSIVNCDQFGIGYYAGKQAQEELVRSDKRGTVLRATQFHEFASQLLSRMKGPIVVLPTARIQPVSTREVAAMLVEAALAPPHGRAPDIAGPEPRDLIELVRLQLRATATRRFVVPVRVPGRTGAKLRRGALLPSTGARLGSETFEQWLTGSSSADHA